MKRAIVVVMDSVGVGELPDAADFGDAASDTLGTVIRTNPKLKLPNLCRLGMFRIDGLSTAVREWHGACYEPKTGAYGKAAEVSLGKDTTTGHWEICGVHNLEPFLTFPNGFPVETIVEFERRTGRKTICNRPVSGTEILKELGERHMRTGELIVYTSADSVFQIAAHEEVVPLNELYRCCEIAREMLRGDVGVARVIARPFVGSPGHFERTPNRRDYSVKPPRRTLLDDLKAAGKSVKAVGKIADIFDGEGITHSVHTVSNADGMRKTADYMSELFEGMIFTNLVDFDSKYGHRRDPVGYGRALEEFDALLPSIMDAMLDEDLLLICADHGNDPCFAGTDHTREYIPILAYGKAVRPGTNLGIRESFSDIGATVADYLQTPYSGHGKSFLRLMSEGPKNGPESK